MHSSDSDVVPEQADTDVSDPSKKIESPPSSTALVATRAPVVTLPSSSSSEESESEEDAAGSSSESVCINTNLLIYFSKAMTAH